MNKTGIIFMREYSTRVKNKTFILSTFLLPFIIALLITAVIYLSLNSVEMDKIAVNDSSGIFMNQLITDSSRVSFAYSTSINPNNFSKLGYSALLMIPSVASGNRDTIRLISEKQVSLMTEEYIKSQLTATVRKMLFEKNNFNRKMVDSILATSVATLFEFNAYQQKKGKIEESHFWLAYCIAFASGFLIYITVMLYGTMVMRGVMEEKTNRISEIMVSSVRPFELMMGKITGIAAVGLTQFLLWIFLIGLLALGANAYVHHEAVRQFQQLSQNINLNQMPPANGFYVQLAAFNHLLGAANWPLILFCFIFYFTGGYLFYSSLFAAIGSLVNDNSQEAGSLALPVMMPIIFSFVMMTILIYFPASSVSIWASIIPFSSPIIMMSRIPFGVPGTVPWWQLGLSMFFLVSSFLFSTWLSGKIYRTGILLYGKKPSWKEMWKWVFKKS